jgi:tetraacyldisaccharide 4'-kinase
MAGPAACGDEPYMLAKKVGNVPVVVARKRYLAGLRANEYFGSRFFILDDGYQHLQLKRDLNVLLLDAEAPFGNGQLLPCGPLREPLTQLARADAFVLTRCGEGRRYEKTRAYLADRYPEQPVFLTDHVPEKVVFPNLQVRRSPGFLAGKRVAAFAGIGQPERFRKTLIKVGAEVAAFRAFADHHRFSRAELKELLGKQEELGVEAILTTEKDWARIAPLDIEHTALGYLSIKMTFLSGRNAFYRLVQSRASEAHDRRRNRNIQC